jgi:hypothetical protein
MDCEFLVRTHDFVLDLDLVDLLLDGLVLLHHVLALLEIPAWTQLTLSLSLNPLSDSQQIIYFLPHHLVVVALRHFTSLCQVFQLFPSGFLGCFLE